MWNKFRTGVTVRKYFQFILQFFGDACAGAQYAFIERKGQRAASWYHRYYTFTLAIVHCCRLELAFPPRTAVHATYSHSHFKYPYEKMFRWIETFVVEQYTSNEFSDEWCLRIFPLGKRLITIYDSITLSPPWLSLSVQRAMY